MSEPDHDARRSTRLNEHIDLAERACMEEAERRLDAVLDGALDVVDGDHIMTRLREGKRP